MEQSEDQEPAGAEFSPAPKEIDTLPARLGFETTQELDGLRDAVLEALAQPDKELQKAAWGRYLDVAEPISNDFPNEKGRLALSIEQALIWRESGDVQEYLLGLIMSHSLAGGLVEQPATDILYDEIATYYDTPVYLAGRDAYKH